MHAVVYSPTALEDLEAILDRSENQFGPDGRERYEALLEQAIQDIRRNPLRPGTRLRSEISDQARTYHLKLSRMRVPADHRVKNPRHFLLYRVRPNRVIEIGRLIHDSMDLSSDLAIWLDDD